MVSRSYSNLLDLAGGELPSPPAFSRMTVQFPRIMTVSGIVSDTDDDPSDSVSSGLSSPSIPHDRLIIVANQLPIRAHRKTFSDGSNRWDFSLDENSLLLQLKDGLGPGPSIGPKKGSGPRTENGPKTGSGANGPGITNGPGNRPGPDGMEVIYVGCLKEEIHPSEQDEVSQILLEKFKCVPTFFPPGLYTRFYHGFCKQQLWPLFHYMLPLSPDLGGRFNRSLWQAYVSVNKIFADRIMEVINPEDDFVWIHDYHLMALPTFLRKRFNRVKLGFFLHSPFPSSEIYKTLPVREEILRALLNSDLIGFHTFDYARHFLSCCSRMLGISYESKRGYISLEYYGRTVSIKILPVGIHMKRLQTVLNLPETESKVSELLKQFKDQGKTMLLGVDDMDIFKGISLKFLAMEQLLIQHPEWQGKLVLVQIANPARGNGNDVKEVKAETYSTVKRINELFRKPGYEPIILIDQPLKFYERVAYYVVAECCLVTAVRDGMNLMPYEYIISRQGNDKLDKVLGLEPSSKKSMLVVSEFIGCSPSLSGAIRVNPWDIDSVADAMDCALELSEPEKQLRHEKHYRYVSTHDVGYWARSFMQDLKRTCIDHVRKRSWGIGFGLSFRVVALDPNFRKLSMEHIVSAYKQTTRRAILLDYDGTLMPQSSIDKSPSLKTVEMINTLCRDKNNMVFIVSARSRNTLAEWFASCEKLGLAAEHGCFLRLKRDEEWETCVQVEDSGWKQNAYPIMTLYTETTDGSMIETKDTSMVWSYEDADPDFGSCQAKELLDHLESVLANEPVTVKREKSCVEIKPQGVSKGLVVKRLLATMHERGTTPDFVLCIGDDRSDEDMFEVITSSVASDKCIAPNAEVFACTVGNKPSKAKYYLDDTVEIARMMQGLALVSEKPC
ncbi:putative alpha,alpha-trehalose-phosphate synthase (UDP-forming), Trehalose-phosphatase [Helianthus anomalus]